MLLGNNSYYIVIVLKGTRTIQKCARLRDTARDRATNGPT